MKSLKIIQLGDIHFPDEKGKLIGDIKDKAVSSSLTGSVTPNRLELVMRKVSHIASNQDVCGLLICGDLTTNGVTDDYEKCVEYLNRCMEISDAKKWPMDSLHVVPGNHDVNRKLCDPAGVDLFKKFRPLTSTWDKFSRSAVLPVEKIRSTIVNHNSNHISLFSLNSCIGCGESRHLPDRIKSEFAKLLDDYCKTSKPDDAFALIGEQLDTPAFMDEHVQDLVRSIEEMDKSSVPIVLAHHNALPQSIPRLQIYTELINGGLFRSQLASCDRPVIYCHGHIHDDPVEQLIDHRYPKSRVLFVSAPLLVHGFNVIEIVFARNGLPIGCEVHKYRISNHGSVDKKGTVSMPLAGNELLPHFDDDKTRAVLSICGSDPIRFKELRKMLQDQIGLRPKKDTVRDVVVEAEWLGLVEINDRELPPEHWKIRRVGP